MTSNVETTRGRPETIRAVPVRHPGRWATAAVIGLLVAMLVHMLVTNENLEWNVVGHYFWTPIIRDGVVRTIWLTLACMGIGVALGVIAAVMRLSSNRIVATAAYLYTWFFRGTPVLVQIIFWFNIPLLIKSFSIGIPFGPEFWSEETKTLVTPTMAALLALGLNEGAYMSEIVRAGIISVDEGQSEAAQALGMTRLQVMRRIVLPQAMRVIIPPTGNETISMLKTTSLLSVISVFELFRSAEAIYNANYKVVPLLIVASVWYLILTTVLSFGQFYVERHYARGSSRNLPPTPLQQVRRMLLGSARLGSARRPEGGNA
jgi:polar amino acid transport system permease protein